MEISGKGAPVTIEYTTLDIPVLIRWNFIQSPLVVGVFAGPYLSVPMGKLTVSRGDKGSTLDLTGISYGGTAGAVVAHKFGPGNILADIRFLHDAASLLVRENFGEGVQDAKICIRRSVNVTAGYEFSL
jgi:hypothetical protein